MTPTDLAALEADFRVLWTEDVLRYGDTDANGHINNAAFSALCESGRVHLLTQTLTPVLPPGLLFVIVKLEIAFRAELHYPGRVRTGTWFSRLGRSSMTVEQVLSNEGRVVATCEGICVVLDARTRRAVPLPEAARVVVAAWLRSP